MINLQVVAIKEEKLEKPANAGGNILVKYFILLVIYDKNLLLHSFLYNTML